MDKRAKNTAQMFHILEHVEKLEQDLLKIKDVKSVDFDLNGLLSDIKQVIFLTEYDIPASAEDYFERHSAVVTNVMRVISENNLVKTEDRIEDHGRHYYFVTSCRKWDVLSLDKAMEAATQ